MNSYNPNDIQSIYEYATQLNQKRLIDISKGPFLTRRGKGAFGQMIEESFFKYAPNCDPEADFKEAGLELKTTPLKILKNGKLTSKERLVCCMFNFMNDYATSFEDSHLWNKIAKMLLLFYIHETGKPLQELLIEQVYLYFLEHRPNDRIIIEQDYEYIINKIKQGQAHTLSEGETNYLGVARKGAGGDGDLQQQPFSDEKAYKRAFCLKSGYMKSLWAEIFEQRKTTSVLDTDELQKKGVNEIIYERLRPYLGKTYAEISTMIGKPISNAKNAASIISQEILGCKKGEENELTRLDLKVKVIRVKEDTLKPFESMSFPAMNYAELAQEEIWEDSEIYEHFSQRFLFVVYTQKNKEDKQGVLRYAFTWSMPHDDLLLAQDFWLATRDNVRENEYENFWSLGDHKKFHIRPHATKSHPDTNKTPDGSVQKIKSAWFNYKYVQSIVAAYVESLEKK